MERLGFWYSDLMDLVMHLLCFTNLNAHRTLYFGYVNLQQQLFTLDKDHSTFSIEQTEKKVFSPICIQTFIAIPTQNSPPPPITLIQIHHLLTKTVLELTSIKLTHF